MKKFIIALLVAAMCPVLTFAQQSAAKRQNNNVSQFYWGPKVGLNSQNESLMVGGVVRADDIYDKFGASLDVLHVIRNNNINGWSLNLDANYMFELKEAGFINIYPLAGLSLTTWKVFTKTEGINKEVSYKDTRLGLNLGGGMNVKLNNTQRLNFEAKYNFTNGYSCFTFAVGWLFMADF